MKITLNNVRLSFPVLFEPKAIGDSDNKSFSAAFLFPPGSDAEKKVRKAISDVAADKWAARAPQILAQLEAADRTCLHNGSSKQYAGYDGMLFVNASNPKRPTVLDRDKTPLFQEDGRPYGGCYVNAIIDVWAQDNKYGKRVNATLSGLQFFKDGEAFSGGAPATADDFEDLSDFDDDDDI